MASSSMYIPPQALEALYFRYFEPQAVKTTFNDLGFEFLSFLLNDTDAKRILKESSPPFIEDLIRFDRARAYVRLEGRLDPVLLEGTLLKHPAFITFELEHDVPALMRGIEKMEEADELPHPEPKKMCLLMVRHDENPGYRVFEIDASVMKFLMAQLHSPLSTDALTLPDCHDALVELGLCKPLIHH